MRWQQAAADAQSAAAVANPSFAASTASEGLSTVGGSVRFSTSFAGASASAANSSRQSRQSVSERLVSGGLNLIGTIANTLAEDDDVLDGTEQEQEQEQELSGGGAAAAAASSGGRELAGEGAAAEVWRRRCLEQRRIVDTARAELLLVLQGMDAQIAALDDG